jgi:hypothetical protein
MVWERGCSRGVTGAKVLRRPGRWRAGATWGHTATPAMLMDRLQTLRTEVGSMRVRSARRVAQLAPERSNPDGAAASLVEPHCLLQRLHRGTSAEASVWTSAPVCLSCSIRFVAISA